MPPRKNAQDFFRNGRKKGSEQCNRGIDGSAVFKKVTSKAQKEYDRMIGLWEQYVKNHAEDKPNPHDVKSLKNFVKEIAFGIDGAENDLNPALGTVMLYWKQFMAGWRCKHEAILNVKGRTRRRGRDVVVP